MYEPHDNGEFAWRRIAFGKGCDSRLLGLKLSSNPYPREGSKDSSFTAWRLGWFHVHRYWGAGLKRQWPTPLLLIKGDPEGRGGDYDWPSS